jgi:hypothetical protein
MPERQDLSDRAAGQIAARNRLADAEEAERAALGELGAAGDPPAHRWMARLTATAAG